MLPAFLVNTYKRYKQETSDFLGWLRSTAETCGYEKSDADEKFTEEQEFSASSSESKQYNIRLSSFVPRARAIADHDPRVSVPSHIAQTGLRIIRLRERCASWFTTQAQGSHKAIVQHAHFIKVFGEALQVLGINSNAALELGNSPASSKIESKDKKNKKKKNKTQNSVEAALHRFTALELYEPHETPDIDTALTAKESAVDKSAPNESRRVQYEVTDDISEDSDEPEDLASGRLDESDDSADEEVDLLAVFCLLEDLRHIGEFIDQLWDDYKSEKVDLMTAAVVTNTAIDLVRRQCSDLSLSHLRIENDNSISRIVYLLTCQFRKGEAAVPGGPNDPLDFDLYDTVQWCYFDTWILLKSFANMVSANGLDQIPTYKNGYFGVYDPSKDRSSLSAKEKFTEDKILLSELVPHFAFLSGRSSSILPVADEFTKGIQDMFGSGQVPFWLCFAARVWLNIQHRLRSEVATPFKQLSKASQRIKKTLEAYFDFSEFMTSPNWPTQNDKELKKIILQIDMFITRDIFVVVRHEGTKNGDDDHLFLKRHCLQAGIMLFNFNLRVSEAGQQLSTAWGSIIYPAFLYNEVQNEKYVSISWPDMEQVITFHGEKNMFAGSRPKDIDATVKQSQTMLGFSNDPNAWRNFDGKNVPETDVGPQGLSEPTVISRILKNRYTLAGSVDISLKNVENLLNDLARKEESTRSNASAVLNQKWNSTRKLSSLELLALLRERLMDEERMLVFNYFGLHQRCIQLLRLLKDEHHAKFLQYFGPNYLEQEYQLSFVCNWIFTVVQGSQAAAQQLNVMRNMPKGSQRLSLMMTKTGNLMKDWLKKSGSIAAKELASTVTNKHLLDPVKAAENKSKGLLDSGYLIPAAEVLGIDRETIEAAQAEMRNTYQTMADSYSSKDNKAGSSKRKGRK